MQEIIIYVLRVDIYPQRKANLRGVLGGKSFVCKCKTFEGLASLTSRTLSERGNLADYLLGFRAGKTPCGGSEYIKAEIFVRNILIKKRFYFTT